MAKFPFDPVFVNLEDEPIFTDPLNINPIQAIVPIPFMNTELRLTSIPGQPSVSEKL